MKRGLKIVRLKISLPLDVNGAWPDFALKVLNQVDVRRGPWQVCKENRSPCVLACHLDTVVEFEEGRVGSFGKVHKLSKMIHSEES